jgi:hypothetical protein
MNSPITSRLNGKAVSLLSLVALLIFLPLLLLAAYETATIISRAAGEPARIIVDAGRETGEVIEPEFIHAFTEGKEEMNNWFRPGQTKASLPNPQRVRIKRLYDYYVTVTRQDGTLVFNFSRADRLIDAIRATGALPVISLSYMPQGIARDGVITNQPVDWDEWSFVVQKTIEHFSGGGRNIPDIYYEVWNEPDLPQFGGWTLEGDKNYLTLYDYTAKGAGRVEGANRFYLGGPATSKLYQNWVQALAGRENRLDFLSWHTYSDDPARFAFDHQDVTAWLIRYPEAALLPRLITEFGFTDAKDLRYGTRFSTAYTASVFRYMAPLRPKGLFSIEPQYQLFSYLDRMKGVRLALTGEGTWVKALAIKQGTRRSILLVNYDPTGNHVETVPVSVIGLQNGTYEYSKHSIDGSVDEIRKTQTETIKDGTFTKQIYMPAQSVILLELTLPNRR